MTTSGMKRRVSVAVFAVVTLLAWGSPAQAGPRPPDEFHCVTLTVAGHELCLRLNQVLGWWTGFTARFHMPASIGGWTTVQVVWSSTQGQRGVLPEPARALTVYPGDKPEVGSWADLPSFACVTASTHAVSSTGTVLPVRPVTVCRDN